MMDGDWKKLIREARRKGWIVRIRKNSHMLWVSPEGQKVYSSASGERHAMKAHLRMMRRAGWND